MGFDLKDFIAAPSASLLVDLNKSQWKELVAHYGIPVRPSFRKDELIDVVLQHLVTHSIITREDMEDHFPFETLKRRQLELEFERVQVEKLKAENDRLRLEQGSNNVAPPNTFHVKEAIRFVPTFSEKDPEHFFMHFERAACLHGWPRDKWILLIDSAFVGRAQEVVATLDAQQFIDYDALKTAVLNAYEKVPESYRQEFRNCRKTANETFVEFIRRKEILCRKWVERQI